MKRSKTDTIIKALNVLSVEIHSEDGIANAAIREAAERMAELQSLLREASGPMSYERWSTAFRRKVQRALSPNAQVQARGREAGTSPGTAS